MACIITAEYDLLRDDGEAYAKRLSDVGVEVYFKRYDGIIHVFFICGGQWKKLEMLFLSYVQNLLKPLIIRSMFILQWLVY